MKVIDQLFISKSVDLNLVVQIGPSQFVIPTETSQLIGLTRQYFSG